MVLDGNNWLYVAAIAVVVVAVVETETGTDAGIVAGVALVLLPEMSNVSCCCRLNSSYVVSLIVARLTCAVCHAVSSPNRLSCSVVVVAVVVPPAGQ